MYLGVFADEIAPEFGEQVTHCLAEDVKNIELRSVDGVNVLDLDADACVATKKKARAAGIVINCIGSPIGKVKIDEPFEPHFERFKLAVERAKFFDAGMVRIFSFYPAEGETKADLIANYRGEVLRRLEAMTEYVANSDLVLVHENEGRIYGEMAAQCLDIHTAIDSPNLRAVFDPGNYIVAGQDTLEAWQMLKPYVVHFHIKDATTAPRRIVPAGEGDGHIPEILADAHAGGIDCALSLEPHLRPEGPYEGMNGAQRFKLAADALKQVCARASIPLT